MSGSSADEARRRGVVTRAFAVHLLAYAVALPWAIASLPIVFAWKEPELLAMADEHDAALRVVKWSLAPAAVAWLLAHLPGLPWVLSARRGTGEGKRLYVGLSAAAFVAGTAAAVLTWLRLFA